MKLKSICVYAGSNPGLLPEYMQAAYAFGGSLARRGIQLVYGGAKVGLMGAVADGALSEGGEVTGVMPQRLMDKEIAHRGLTKLIPVRTMHERKTLMAELSDAFVALPGGIGTLEEIFEVYTWTQLGFQTKPCGFLDVAGFYSPLMGFLEHMVAQKFVRAEHHASLFVEDDAERMLDRMAAYEHQVVDKWFNHGSLQDT